MRMLVKREMHTSQYDRKRIPEPMKSDSGILLRLLFRDVVLNRVFQYIFKGYGQIRLFVSVNDSKCIPLHS